MSLCGQIVEEKYELLKKYEQLDQTIKASRQHTPEVKNLKGVGAGKLNFFAATSVVKIQFNSSRKSIAHQMALRLCLGSLVTVE